MPKFIIIYNGPATPPDQLDTQKSQLIMAGWKTWMEKVDGNMLDMGQPMTNGRAVVDDGSKKDALQLNGYSIIQADSIDAAVELVRDHPFLSDKTGEFSVEVFELMPTHSM